MNINNFSHKAKLRLIGSKNENNVQPIKKNNGLLVDTVSVLFLSLLIAFLVVSNNTSVLNKETFGYAATQQHSIKAAKETPISWGALTNEEIFNIEPSNLQKETVEKLRNLRYHKIMSQLNSEQQLWTQRIAHQYNMENSAAAQIVLESVKAGQKQGIDPRLLLSIIAAESSFSRRTENDTESAGWFHIIPGASNEEAAPISKHSDLPIKNSNNIKIIAEAITEYLRLENGSVRRALNQYNRSAQDKGVAYFSKISNKHRKIFLEPIPERILPSEVE